MEDKSNTFPLGAAGAIGSPAPSSPLAWSTAVQMMNEYRANARHLYTYYQPSTGTRFRKAILQGFRVKVDALQSLMNGDLTDNVVPDEIFISFGVAPSCLGQDPDTQGFTLLLSGIKLEDADDYCGNIILTGDTPVLEYCDPCPTKCPKNLAAELRAYPGDLPCCSDCIDDAPCKE